MMTVGTVQFNDLNINLDDNDPQYYGLAVPKQTTQENKDFKKDKNIDNHKWGKEFQYK